MKSSTPFIAIRLLALIVWSLISEAGLSSGLAAQDADPEAAQKFRFERVGSYGPVDQSHTDAIKNVLLIDPQRALSCAADGSIGLWDLQTGKLLRRFVDEAAKTVYCVAAVRDNRFVIGGGDGSRVVMWELESGKVERAWPTGSRPCCLDVCTDGRAFLVGDANGNITQFDFLKEQPIAEYRAGKNDVTALRCLADGSGFVCGDSSGHVCIWKFDAEKPAQTLTGLDTWVCCVQLSVDPAQIAASDYNGNVALWDLTTGKRIWFKPKVSGEICWLRFLNEKQLVAVNGSDQLYKFDRQTGDSTTNTIDMPSLGGFDLSSDHQLIYCGGKNQIAGWNVADGKLAFPSPLAYRQSGPISQLALVGNVICSIGSSSTVTGRSLEAGKIVFEADLDQVFGKPTNGKNVALFAIDDQLIAASSDSMATFKLAGSSGESVNPAPLVAKIELTSICGSPDPKALLGVDRKRNRIVEFYPTQPGDRRRDTGNSTAQAKNLQSLGKRFFVGQEQKSFAIYSYPSGTTVFQKQLEFEPTQIVADENLVLLTDGVRLIGFAAPPLADGQALSLDRIEHLVNQLNSNKYDVREAATIRLASSGESVLQQIEQIKSVPAEARARISRIRQMIENRGLPDLDKLATSNIEGPIEALAVHPQGEFWAAAIRRSWKSEIHWGQIVRGQFVNVQSQPLRSRATVLEFSNDGNRLFAGYADGSIDQFTVVREPE